MTEQAREEAKRLFHYEPEPIIPGANAGTRREGLAFRDRMRGWLDAPDVQVETVLGKSTDGTKVDGNAQERVTFKMLRFKRAPMNRNRMLVIAFNEVFNRCHSDLLAELKHQAAYLNGLSPFAPIWILDTEDEYDRYFDTVHHDE